MLVSKSHATLKVPCYYEQIFGGARFARRSRGAGRHLGHIWETPGSLSGSWAATERPEASLARKCAKTIVKTAINEKSDRFARVLEG